MGYSKGWTHYEAAELNRALEVFEKKSRELGGFNGFAVTGFHGHAFSSINAGVEFSDFKLGLEFEYWWENFSQPRVGFDGDTARDYRISCEILESPGFVYTPPSGCLDASEDFFFAPVSIFGIYQKELAKNFRGGLGYSLGIMAGSTTLDIATKYYGEGSLPADRLTFGFYPGINTTHKFFIHLQYQFWRYFGLQFSGGWRLLNLPKLEVNNLEGSSRIFEVLFETPENGDALYLKSNVGGPSQDDLIIGHIPEGANPAQYNQVEGDFSGWYLNLNLILFAIPGL